MIKMMSIILMTLVTALLSSISFFLAHRSLKTFPPSMEIFVSGISYVIIMSVVLLFHHEHISEYFDIKKYKEAWVCSILKGLIVYGVANMLLFTILKKTDKIHLVAALVHTVPFFTILISIFVLQHEVTLISIIGILFIMTGSALIVLESHK